MAMSDADFPAEFNGKNLPFQLPEDARDGLNKEQLIYTCQNCL